MPAAAARVRRVGWDVVAAAAPAGCVAAADPDAVCVLAYTSGTTSDPKGVMHTHRTLLAELAHIRAWITPGTPNLMGSPVTHATGMLGAVLAPMQLGEDIHLIDRWDPRRVLDVMLEADVGAGTGASVFLASILDHPDFTPEHARRIRRVGLGGAPVPLAVAERAAAHGIAIVRAYGSTEHPSVTGCGFDDPVDKRHGTDGRPMPGVEIRLVDDRRRRRRRRATPVRSGRGARPVPRLHRRRAHRRSRSTPTVGIAPATWAWSTPTGTSPSPTG